MPIITLSIDVPHLVSTSVSVCDFYNACQPSFYSHASKVSTTLVSKLPLLMLTPQLQCISTMATQCKFGQESDQNVRRQCNISLGLHGRVIGTLQAGATVKEAATSVRRSERTVRNLRTKYRQKGSVTDKPCSGCASILLTQQKKIIYRKARATQKIEYSELIKEKVFVNLEGQPSKPLSAANYTKNLRDVVSLIIRPRSVQNSIAGMLLYVLSLQESTATSCRVAAHLSSQVSAQSRRVQTPTKGGVFDFCGRNG
jgi:hypothetical protein